MSMSAELQATFDAALATLLADLTAAQEASKATLAGPLDTDGKQAARNKYAQVLPGADWTPLGMETPKLDGCSVWVDEYVGSEGVGWVLNAEAVDGKTTYRRVMQSGPETWREQDWVEVPA